jgi:hypothetical protein
MVDCKNAININEKIVLTYIFGAINPAKLYPANVNEVIEIEVINTVSK